MPLLHKSLSAMLLFLLVAGSARTALAAPAAVQIQLLGVDPTDQPTVAATVLVRDAFGHGVKNLRPADFVVEEDGQPQPSDRVTVTPRSMDGGTRTLAVVADTSSLLGPDAVNAVRADAHALVAQALAGNDATEVAVFTPRGDAPGQALTALDFTADAPAAEAAVAGLAPREGNTSLYNAVAAAISASATRAAERGGSATVIVLSNGLDSTSITGGGSLGANEAARLAEDRHVRVYAFGYGAGTDRGSSLLSQLADRAGGTYQAAPAPAALKTLLDTIRTDAAGGAYELRFPTALGPDGAEHTLSVGVRTGDGSVHAERRYVLPRQLDSKATARLDVVADARSYPNVVLLARPVNVLRHTVANLDASSFTVNLDGERDPVPLRVEAEPLSASDPAAAQSVALVAALSGDQRAAVPATVLDFLQAPLSVPSRVALFVPGASDAPATFSHDRNAVMNALNALASQPPAGQTSDALLRAIEAAARDADTATRPAYVLLVSDEAMPLDARVRALTLARARGVTISVVAPTGQPVAEMRRLAVATGGEAVGRADAARLAQRIADDRATRYRISFRSPLFADGKRRQITLSLGDKRVELPVTPLITGSVIAPWPLPLPFQALVFGLVTLAILASGLLPNMLRDRRLRCPTCGRVRRQSWGTSCLFCEYNASAPNVLQSAAALDAAPAFGAAAHIPMQGREPTPSPLDGFAAQGAALIEAALPPPAPAREPQPLPEPTPAQQPTPAPQPTAAQQARVRSHTDFWGPLPDEPVIPQPAIEPVGPVVAPPVAPAAPPAAVRAQKRAGSGVAAASEPAAQAARQQSHTDFWGPLPDAPPAAPAHAVADTKSPEPPASPAPQTGQLGYATGKLDAPPAARLAPPPAKPNPPANHKRQDAPGHTDFWGPLPDEEQAPPEVGVTAGREG